MKRLRSALGVFIVLLVCVSCSVLPIAEKEPASSRVVPSSAGEQIVIYALGLVGIDYRFGGKNPASGLDCSGMVAYIYKNALGINLPTNALLIAQIARPIDKNKLRPGDLVFFNTLQRPFSHVGIYIGEARFVHAPGTNGKIKISSLESAYYLRSYQSAATLFP